LPQPARSRARKGLSTEKVRTINIHIHKKLIFSSFYIFFEAEKCWLEIDLPVRFH
jgi:hypothetical protein